MNDGLLLRVSQLSVGFNTELGPVRVVENVSFAVPRGHTVGLVGESGCGKSVTAHTIMRLLPSPPSRIDGGRIFFSGTDLLTLSEKEMQKIRGDRIGMIFQEPMTSLNPTMRVEDQIVEVLRLHRGLRSSQARPLAAEILKDVGIANPGHRLQQYPHELSGGLRQRVMIAIALVCRPSLLIADEPTTALDVTVQAEMLALLAGVCREFGMALLLVTHDLGVVAALADRIAVMNSGRLVETATAADFLRGPRHPYSAGLLAAVPTLAAIR
jgi:ABC-type dipeptide/oligopeptide/nickel transport system ATPase component